MSPFLRELAQKDYGGSDKNPRGLSNTVTWAVGPKEHCHHKKPTSRHHLNTFLTCHRDKKGGMSNPTNRSKAKTKENPHDTEVQVAHPASHSDEPGLGTQAWSSTLETEAGNCLISFQVSLGYRMRLYLKQTNGPNWQVFFKPKLK